MSVQAISWVLGQVVRDAGQKLVLICLANHSSASGRDCFPTIATLSAESSLSDRSVQRRLRELEEAGWIEIVDGRAENGRQRANCYRLRMTEEDALDRKQRGEAASTVTPADSVDEAGEGVSLTPLDADRGDTVVTGEGDTVVTGEGDTVVTPLKESVQKSRHIEPCSLRSHCARARNDAIDSEFTNQFWPAYPHKVGKPIAQRAFHKARRHHELAAILAGLALYIAGKPADRQWLNPATFLNQERFYDEPAPEPRRDGGDDPVARVMAQATDASRGGR